MIVLLKVYFEMICLGHDINKELFYDMLDRKFVEKKFSFTYPEGEK